MSSLQASAKPTARLTSRMRDDGRVWIRSTSACREMQRKLSQFATQGRGIRSRRPNGTSVGMLRTTVVISAAMNLLR